MKVEQILDELSPLVVRSSLNITDGVGTIETNTGETFKVYPDGPDLQNICFETPTSIKWFENVYEVRGWLRCDRDFARRLQKETTR